MSGGSIADQHEPAALVERRVRGAGHVEDRRADLVELRVERAVRSEAEDRHPVIVVAVEIELPVARCRRSGQEDPAVDVQGQGQGDVLVVPALVGALRDHNQGARRAAAHTLGNIRAQARAAVPALIEALKDEDYRVRRDAAEALGRIGRDAMAAVPALTQALNDVRIHQEAQEALRRIVGESDNQT